MTDFLNYLGNCPVCNRRLRSDKATIIEKTPRRALVEAECNVCAVSLLVTVIKTAAPLPFHSHAGAGREGELVAMVGMVTDLTASDAKKFLGRSPLTAEEVLALHCHFTKRN